MNLYTKTVRSLSFVGKTNPVETITWLQRYYSKSDSRVEIFFFLIDAELGD